MIDTGDSQWLGDLLPHVVDLAYQAGSAIMSLYEKGNSIVMTKSDDSLQTEADKLSHTVIMNALTKLSQDWPIVSEEGPEFPFAEREQWRYFWLIDPLDGTKEFIRQIDEFTVNIALIERHAPILGVVYSPARGTLYCATKGGGAWKSNGDDRSQIWVSQPRKEAVRVLVSRSHGGTEKMLAYISGMSEPYNVIAMGSSLKFCLVAEGSADLYPRTGRTMEWDTAAAQCILEEAGGRVTDTTTGHSIGYNKRLLANNGFLAQGQLAASADLSFLLSRPT